MKTKTLALALMLTLGGYAAMAQNDSIPKKDSIPSNDTTKVSNLMAFNSFALSQRDTVPKTDSVPKKDSSMAFNFNSSRLDLISQRDSVPTKDTTKTDTSLVFNLSQNERAVANNIHRRDTVPNNSDSTKKDSTLAVNQTNSFDPVSVVIMNDQQENALKREQSAAIREKNIS